MEITVNNNKLDVPEEYKLKDLLNELGYSKSVAIFINGKQIFMAEYDVLTVKDNDTVKIIRPLGGG